MHLDREVQPRGIAASATRLDCQCARSVGSAAREPKPSTTTRTCTPRSAAAASMSAIARAVASLWKMYVASQTSCCAPSMAVRMAGKRSSPPVSNRSRLPPLKSPPSSVSNQPTSNSATSGRWSDMRAQAAPRGTKVERQASPRV
jgi:hypothetical protein